MFVFFLLSFNFKVVNYSYWNSNFGPSIYAMYMFEAVNVLLFKLCMVYD